MSRPYIKNIFFKCVLVIACAMMGTFHAHSQTKETTAALQSAPDEGEPDTMSAQKCCAMASNGFGGMIYGDFGGANVISKTNGKSASANGLGWALGAQAAYNMQCCKSGITTLAAGFEIRNYNGTASSTDRYGAAAYDNLHYWYVGIPVSLTMIHGHCKCAKQCNMAHYLQLGVVAAMTANVNDLYSMQGVSTTYDTTGHYKKFMLQPYMSIGIAYQRPGCTYLLGPYIGYTANNLVNNSAITQHILSYGIKLTTSFY